jgi:hypothetical protein
LEVLTRRLAECPPEFLAEPRFGRKGTVDVAAVVADLVRDLGGPPLTTQETAALRPPDRREHRNRLRTVLVAGWLLYDPWFRARHQYAGAARGFLLEGVAELAALVQAPELVSDGDRREELARLALRGLGLRPAGETPEQAEDRLLTLSSVERQRVLRESQAAEERARQIREAMAAQAALEATATYSPG